MVRLRICIVFAHLIALVLIAHVDTLAFERHKLVVSISGDRSSCNIIKNYGVRINTPYLPAIPSRAKPHPGIYGLTISLSYKISKIVSLSWLGFYSQKTPVYRNYPYGYSVSGDYDDRLPGRLNTDSQLSGSGLGFNILPKIYKIRPVLSAALLICQVNTRVKFTKTIFVGFWDVDAIKIDNETKDWGYLGTFSLGIPFNLSGKYSLTPFIGYKYSDKLNIKNNDHGITTDFKLNYSSLWSGLIIDYRI
jgi:hypothetical protein